MFYKLDDLEADISKNIEIGNLDYALQLINEFTLKINQTPWCDGIIFDCPMLDLLCQKIGSLTLNKFEHKINNNLFNKDLFIYLFSHIDKTGGHILMLTELVKMQPFKKHVIINTNIYEFINEEISEYYKNFNIEIIDVPKMSLIEKVIWIQKKLIELLPGKVFLFNHPFDCLPIAAVQEKIINQLFFYHHADHTLCLGNHLSYANHIDPHSHCYYNCRENLKIKNNIYWPLVSEDYGYNVEKKFMNNGFLKTCSSGNRYKFEKEYIFSYSDLIPQLLQLTKGSHLHIGPLSSNTIDKIKNKMKELSIPEEKFIHLEWVKSVWTTLQDYDVDLYINSFPIVGLRATLEVMGCGIPVVFHEHYSSQIFGGIFIGYPEAFIWKKPNELFEYLKILNPTYLKQQSIIAREYYEKNHHPRNLKRSLEMTDEEIKFHQPPILKKYEPNYLQLNLDILKQFNEFKENFESNISNIFFSHVKKHIKTTIKKLLKITRLKKSFEGKNG